MGLKVRVYKVVVTGPDGFRQELEFTIDATCSNEDEVQEELGDKQQRWLWQTFDFEMTPTDEIREED